LSLPRARAELEALTRASACSSGAALIQGLGAATNSGRRPTFSDPEARIHYIHHYARQRCLAFSAALADPVLNFYLTSLLCAPIRAEADSSREAGRTDSSVVDDDAVRVVSIGGGPGFDFIALSLAGVHLRALLDYRERMHPPTGLSATGCCIPNSADAVASTSMPSPLQPQPSPSALAMARVRPLHARIMDNEEGWRSHVEEIAARCASARAPPAPVSSGAASAALPDSAANAALVPPPPWARSRLVFEWGDITSTAMVDGADGLRTLQMTDMYCFQSVCLENAVLLRSCRFGLVRAILRGARVGAIVYVADSSDVLFPELCAVAGEENAVRAVGAWRFHVPKIRKMQKTPNALLLVCEE
jgi:hypothetical protein